MTAAQLLLATLGQVPLVSPPVGADFAPARSEVTIDDLGLEILAFDEKGQMVGALVMTPSEDDVQIDASFADGYVSVGLLLLDERQWSSPEQLEPNLDTDFSPEIASARIEAMLALVSDADLEVASAGAPDPAAATRRECMWLFAGAALVCGVSAVTPGNLAAAAGCLVMVHNGICKCADYIPIKIC